MRPSHHHCPWVTSCIYSVVHLSLPLTSRPIGATDLKKDALTSLSKMTAVVCNWSRSCTAVISDSFLSQPARRRQTRSWGREAGERVTWRASERARLIRLIYHCLVWPPSGRLIAIEANIIIFPEFPRPITDFAVSRTNFVQDRRILRGQLDLIFVELWMSCRVRNIILSISTFF